MADHIYKIIIPTREKLAQGLGRYINALSGFISSRADGRGFRATYYGIQIILRRFVSNREAYIARYDLGQQKTEKK
jgi:hypothetical protein